MQLLFLLQILIVPFVFAGDSYRELVPIELQCPKSKSGKFLLTRANYFDQFEQILAVIDAKGAKQVAKEAGTSGTHFMQSSPFKERGKLADSEKVEWDPVFALANKINKEICRGKRKVRKDYEMDMEMNKLGILGGPVEPSRH
jgi:hypothetical protein